VNYFHYRNSNQALEKVKAHVEQRVSKHLMKRLKAKDIGIGDGRFPNCMGIMGYIKCRPKQAENQRMPMCEKHRKAVCEKIACTV